MFFYRQFQIQGTNSLKASQSTQKMIETAYSKDKISTDSKKSTGFKPSSAAILKTEGENLIGSSSNFTTQNNYFKDGKVFTSYRSDLKGLKSMGNGSFKRALNPPKQEIWVKKWVDYSAKYGLGYLLSNGSTGVYFNDSTKIILDPKGNYFEYFEKRGGDGQDVVVSHPIGNYPTSLQKKVTLLQHFKSYLEGEKGRGGEDGDDADGKTQPLSKWEGERRFRGFYRLCEEVDENETCYYVQAEQ